MSPLISIIVPIYNGRKYLSGLIETFKNQTYRNLEVLLIDDLSTDGSPEILEELIGDDSRFKVLRRTEKGGTAVKGIVYGFNHCTGDYYFYFSQDDFADPDLFEKAMDRALKTNADVVAVNVVSAVGESRKRIGDYPLGGDYTSELSPHDAFFASLTWHLPMNALIKMDLIRRCPYRSVYFNDCEFSGRRIFLKANKIAFCDSNFYYRQDNPDAVTKSVKWYMVDFLSNDIELFELLIENKFEKSRIRARLKEIVLCQKTWTKFYRELRLTFTPEQKRYVLNSLMTSKKKLYRLCFQQRYFAGVIKLLRRDLTFFPLLLARIPRP